MASCKPFSVGFSGDAQTLFNKISSLAHKHGGTISGGPTGGAFTIQVPVFGKIAGTYTVSGQSCEIHITDRSFFLSCGTIESFVKSNIPSIEKTAITEL